MKNILLITSAIVMFHFTLPAQSKAEDKVTEIKPIDFCSITDKTANDARDLLNLLEDVDPNKATGNKSLSAVICEWANAVRNSDTKALEKLFDDDLFVTTHDGKTRTKKEELEALKPDADITIKSVRTEYLRIRQFERTAVVTALRKMHFVTKGKDVYSAYRFTAVFVEDNGDWKLSALQTAKIN